MTDIDSIKQYASHILGNFPILFSFKLHLFIYVGLEIMPPYMCSD